MILRRVKAKHHLQPAVLRAKARFIAHLAARRRHRLLPRTPIVNHFFPLIADDHPLLQHRRGVIRQFFAALLHITKRSRHHNHRDDQNKKERHFTH